MEYKHICENTIELVRKVAMFIKAEREKFTRESVSVKGKHNFVTHVDKGAEEQLVKGLSDFIPGCGFITEEGTAGHDNEKYRWIIDPLDGTTNFIHGAPPYSISVGLLEGDKLILGVVHEITMNETFYAYGDSPAYLNGQEIKVSATPTVNDSLIATGFPYHVYDRMPGFMKTLDYFFHNSHGVRRLGSAAADLAYVACGRYDAFYEYSLNAWDVAAGAFIIQQAGGRVANFKGENDFLFTGEIIATNGKIYNDFQGVIQKFMI